MKIARWILAIGILFFLLKPFLLSLTHIERDTFSPHPVLLMSSFLLLILYFITLGVPWVCLYRGGRPKNLLLAGSRFSAWLFFQISQFGRYLPGKVGQFLLMFFLAKRFRIEKSSAFIATCVHLFFQIGISLCLGIPILQNTRVPPQTQHPVYRFFRGGPTGALLLFSLIGLAICVFIGWGRYKNKSAFALPSLLRETRKLITGAKALRCLGVHLCLWTLIGGAFFLFIKSLHPTIERGHLPGVTATYAVAWGIGVLSFFTPGGLGVRESVLTLLLEPLMPPATATRIALLSRLWTVGAQLVLGSLLLVGCYYWQKQSPPAKNRPPC